jgi:hypothetical protein
MSRKAFDIFFAVGDPSRRSSLWRAWGTPKGDVCLVNCEVNADFKLTLHPPDERHSTGRCHLAFRDEESLSASKSGTHSLFILEKPPEVFAKAEGDGYGRFDDVWDPSEIAPGLVMPFRIGMPHSELRPLRREVLAGREVHWLPAPGEGRTLEVAFMIAANRMRDQDVPGAESMGSRLLIRHEFGEHRTLMIVWRSHDLTKVEQMWATAYRLSIMTPSERVRASFTTHDYHRVIVQVRDEAYRSRAFIDTAIA